MTCIQWSAPWARSIAIQAVSAIGGASSGAIAAGLSPLGLTRRPKDLATQQAAASVGQGLLVHRYTDDFARHGVQAGQVLLTVDDVTRRGHYRNAYRTFAKLLELGLQSGRIRALYGPASETAALGLYRRLPRGA